MGQLKPITLAKMAGCLFAVGLSASATASTNPVDTLQPGEWYKVPNSQLTSVAATNPSQYGSIDCVMDCWTGGAFDTTRGRLYVWGGGHWPGGYAGNEIYAFDINDLAWHRLTNPSPVVDSTGGATPIWTSLDPNTPSAWHLYDGAEYIPPPVDRFVIIGWNGSSSSMNWKDASAPASLNPAVPFWFFDPGTLTWTMRTRFPFDANQYDSFRTGLVSAYDPSTGIYWMKPAAPVGTLTSYAPLLNSFLSHGASDTCGWNQPSWDDKKVAAIDPIHKQFVALAPGTVFAWDIGNVSNTNIPCQKLTTTGDTAILSQLNQGFEFDPAIGKFVAWAGGSDVYTLDPVTRVWTKMVPASTNQVTPTAPNSNGTFGRFRYIPSKNAFIVVNSVNQDVYFYKLGANNGGNPPPPSPFTFSLAISPSGTTSVTAGQSASSTLTAILISGTTQPISFTSAGLPSGASASTSSTSCAPTCSTVLTIQTQTTIPAGSYPISVTAAGGGVTQTISFTLTINGVVAPPPPPSGAIGGYPMPSLADEKATYQQWGWTWNASQEPHLLTAYPGNYGPPATTPYVVADPGVHGDTEGDDLWTYLMMYQRTGQPGYLDRARAWARYFKDDYRQCISHGIPATTSAVPGYYDTYCYDGSQFTYDHMYGWGLIAWYEYTGDAAFLTAAENLASDIEAVYLTTDPRLAAYYRPGAYQVGYYSTRGISRHLLLVTRLADVTHASRWITLRDRLIDLFLKSPDWNATYGMYFEGDWSTDQDLGAGTYAAGVRIVSPFILAIQAEAFDAAYRSTGNPVLRDRLIGFARFVDQYGLDPTYQYTGHRFGVNLTTGQPVHSYSYNKTPAQITFWDPVYTTDLVNVLVRGYKYTGQAHLLQQAQTFFNRGTKGIYGEPVRRAAGDMVVGHFIDTVFDTSSQYFYLSYNKGELQYTYLLFEHGGNPTVLTGLRGDLDGDGKVTLADVRTMIQVLLGQVPVNLSTADLNGDGRLSLADLRALLQLL